MDLSAYRVKHGRGRQLRLLELPLLPQTMQPYDAGECSKAFLPKIVYIYHYEGQKNDEAFFRASLRGTPMDVRVQTK